MYDLTSREICIFFIAITYTMSDENYNKCKSCRFCVHTNDDWVCYFTSVDNGPDGTCVRYRPGICESCGFYTVEDCKERCNMSSREAIGIDVCSMYDPRYSR
jgi:hypothetical protein